ncbi:MAG: endo alpha-1,4 polygalactosaminidase, partial [Vulcanimicrobiaceae bacterium]
MLPLRRLAFSLGLAALAACGSSSSHEGSEQADGSNASGGPDAASADDSSTGATTDDSGSAGTSDSAATATDAATHGHDAGAIWQPTTAAPVHFHWFIGASDTFASTDLLSGQSGQVVYDIDGANSTAADVQAIHAAGAIAVCYVDVGTLEPGRPDEASFTSLSPSVIGPDVQGWPGEKWLLVAAANQSAILPLMQARFTSWCQAKGFDAIEPDNLDAWTNISGVSEADNLTYDLAIGRLAHA